MNTTWDKDKLWQIVGDLIPDAAARVERFRVGTDEMDAELLACFLEQMSADIRDINAAWKEQNWSLVKDKAHSIKGMGGNADMPELSVLAEETERAALAKQPARLAELVAALNHYFSEVTQMIGAE